MEYKNRQTQLVAARPTERPRVVSDGLDRYFVDFGRKEFRPVEADGRRIPFGSPLGGRLCDEPLITVCPACGLPLFAPIFRAGAPVRCLRCEQGFRVDFSRRWE